MATRLHRALTMVLLLVWVSVPAQCFVSCRAQRQVPACHQHQHSQCSQHVERQATAELQQVQIPAVVLFPVSFVTSSLRLAWNSWSGRPWEPTISPPDLLFSTVLRI